MSIISDNAKFFIEYVQLNQYIMTHDVKFLDVTVLCVHSLLGQDVNPVNNHMDGNQAPDVGQTREYYDHIRSGLYLSMFSRGNDIN